MADRMLPVVQPGRQAGTPPVFEKIAIVGLGLIGGSIALAARRTWPSGLVIGVDDKDVLEQAMVLHAIDVAADDLVVIAEADLIVLAAPVRQNLALLGELPDHVAGSAVVTDVGSTKRAIVDAARQLPPRLTFVGGHPLGGAARTGIAYARPDLFEGRPWVFTPAHDRGGAALDRLYRFAEGLGAVPTTMDPAGHDRLMAALSHVPQLTASALMHVVGEVSGAAGLSLAGRGLADTTRLSTSDASVWQDICSTNTDRIGEVLDALIEVLRALRADLPAGEELERVFASAARWRGHLPRRKTDG